MKQPTQTIDEYLQPFPLDVREKLLKVRQTILDNAPGAEEGIAYGMPAYKTHQKPLVYFAGFAKHIGFYATPTGHKQFAEQLSGYKQGKGSVQFPLDQPIPYDLIAEIVRFRVAENAEKKK
ncbi:MAG: DUF1801 domain-containing protein [Saprospiraceae bacterium]|nr:DUF1801 domain-containing protein [Saprospiraceae bacterium]